jgi:hypothetical protein
MDIVSSSRITGLDKKRSPLSLLLTIVFFAGAIALGRNIIFLNSLCVLCVSGVNYHRESETPTIKSLILP